MKEYLEGNKLVGDDYNIDQIKEWFLDEEEAYAELGAKNRDGYSYEYHALNTKLGYRFLPNQMFRKTLGIGSAYGDELKPIIDKLDQITILEPSSAFVNTKIGDHVVSYAKPSYDGIIDFPDNSFDLITCFGVLHHIPNVSTVMSELYRVLSPGGYLLLREPTVSMGDWNFKRKGLTKRERGIPINIFREIITNSNFKVISEKRCMFPLITRLSPLFNTDAVYNSNTAVMIDDLLCRITSWNKVYHPSNILEKLRPTSVFYVLSKGHN